MNYADMTPARARELIREGIITGHTNGMCAGYAQANLCILPREYAYDFLLFTQRNPKPCPVLEVCDTGSRYTEVVARGADTARDFPKYIVYENGLPSAEYTDISHLWRDDFVSFYIGCSFSFEAALAEAGIPLRHTETGRNVPMYKTNIPCVPAGVFGGSMVVSMRPMTPAQTLSAIRITSNMPRVHGAPVHVGEPQAIGIADLGKPDYGESVEVRDGELPVFWACGVTPQAALTDAKIPLAITHAPGHMFITDIKNSALRD